MANIIKPKRSESSGQTPTLSPGELAVNIADHKIWVADSSGTPVLIVDGNAAPTETDPVFTASASYSITTSDITNWNTAYGWGDHSAAGYLTTETDPIFAASAAFSITTTDTGNWNTAYGWGDHSAAGYLSSESDPVFIASAAFGITTGDITNWDASYGWGDHASAGYLTTETDPVFGASEAATITATDTGNWNTAYGWGDHSTAGYLTSETDPTFTASAAYSITTSDITNWNTAYGWGDHASVGYLTAETDPIFTASDAASITATDIGNWNTAYGWGDHSTIGYLTTETDPVFTASDAASITSTDISTWNAKPDSVAITSNGSTITVTDNTVGGAVSFNVETPQGIAATDSPSFAGLTVASLVYPSADGTSGQVLVTDGAGNLSFATAGGGASSLDDLTDVTIITQAANDLLVYNSTSSQWENTQIDSDFISEGTTNLYYTDGRARSALSAGTGISYDSTTGVIINSSPDQTVKLTGGTGISTSGTYPNFTITNSKPDQTVTLTSGTGISTSGTYPSFTITNTSPDQTVKLTSGTGISTSGTYPNFTITNAAPDQTVTLTAGTGIGVTGTYPSFTISSTITQYTDSDARKSLSAGTGITYDNTTGIITNADPDQVVSLTAGTSISISGTYPSFTITNDDPDQIVSLTGGTDISITGTYPSFTIDYTGTAGTGTVTSVDMSVPTGLAVSGNPITTTGTLAITFDTGYSIPTTSDQTNWSTAYTDRLKWDGGSSGLTASTGRTSLGATTIGSNLFTLTNPSAVTFPRFNADNTVSSLDATNFRTAIGAGTSSTTGTVTSIATTSPITGGTITGSGTIGINASSTNTASYVVQRDASGNFSAGTITASLTGNASSATNLANGGAGQIPYNTGSGATSFLAAGTSGQILRSNGTSAPSWETQGIFSSGRLTLESNVPVSTTDQTSKTTIYYTPYNGDKISLYDGSSWATYTFTQLSKSLGTLANNSNYDVFVYNNNGTLTLEFSSAWSTATSRTDTLTLLNGVYVKSSLTSRRYLGTFRTTSTTTTEDSASKRFIWNYNNRVNCRMFKQYAASTWTYDALNTYRYLGNNSANSLAFVNGIREDNIFVMASVVSSGSGIQRELAIGFDSEWSTSSAGNGTSEYQATGVQAEASNESYQSFANRIPGLGYHVAYALELQNSTTIVTYYGGTGSGITANWRY